MRSNAKRRNPRNAAFLLDLFHIAIGVCIVIMAVLCFLNPVEYELLFTLIFLLASILNITSGLNRLRESNRKRTPMLSGILFFAFGILLAMLAVICAICLIGR